MSNKNETKQAVTLAKWIREFSAWIVCLSAISFVGGGLSWIFGYSYGFRIALASVFCFFCFVAVIHAMKYAIEEMLKELEDL